MQIKYIELEFSFKPSIIRNPDHLICGLQVDKEGAEPERVMQELSNIGLLPEDWGGDVPMIQVIMLIVLRYSSGAIINLFSKSTYLGIFSD